MGNEVTITFELTITEFNYLAALAEPAFRTVALFQKMREQALEQTAGSPPMTTNGAAAERPHMPDR